MGKGFCFVARQKRLTLEGDVHVGYGMKVAQLDRKGALLSQPNEIQVPGFTGSDMRVVCNDEYCLVRVGDRGFLVGENGYVVNSYDSYMLATAAGKDDFFAERCLSRLIKDGETTYSACSTQLLGEYGAIVKVGPRERPVHDVLFDGTRYVILTAAGAPGQFEIDTLDPSSGARATAWIGPSAASALVPAESSLRGRLTWNGSMYLITATVAPAHTLPGYWTKPNWLATMRLTPSFAALDPVPVKIASDVHESSALTFWDGTRFEVAGTPDGFRIVWNQFSISRVRTHFVRNDGAVLPADLRGGVLLRDHVSQVARTAAAGRASILAIWSEDDGVHEWLRAARVTRDGVRLDAQPLTLARDPHVDSAFAASDGEGFLVIWNEQESWTSTNGHLIGATIDAGGNVRWFSIRDGFIGLDNVSVDFVDGAYRVALVDWKESEALTISRDGLIVQRESFGDPALQAPFRSAQLFDGSNMLVVQGLTGLMGATKAVPSGKVQARQLLPSDGQQFFDQPALARDGDSVLVFFSSSPGSSRRLMRLSWKGELKALADGFFGGGRTWQSPSIVRVDGVWYASVIDSDYATNGAAREYRIVMRVDPVLMYGYGQIEMPSSFFASRFLAGWNGEGLLLYDSEVDVASGLASQATVRVVHTVPAHGRAVR